MVKYEYDKVLQRNVPLMRVFIKTRDSPLCIAPTLKPCVAPVLITQHSSILLLKQRVQLLTKQPGHQDQLAPEKQTLIVNEEDSSASSGVRRVVLDENETLLGYGIEDGATILLSVRPFDQRPIEGPPPWINDFGTHRSLTRRNIPMPARTRRQILVERDEETNEPLFARQKTDELSRLTIKNIGQIVMKDHMKI